MIGISESNRGDPVRDVANTNSGNTDAIEIPRTIKAEIRLRRRHKLQASLAVSLG